MFRSFSFTLTILLTLGLLLIGCSSSDDNDAIGGDKDQVDSDEADNTNVDGDTEISEESEQADGDSDSSEDDIEAEAEGFSPFVPPQTANPYTDAPFLQEFNHTTNEVEEAIGGIVAVFAPTKSLSDDGRPLQITSRGLALHTGDTIEIKSIPEADPDLAWAAKGGDDLFAASSTKLYKLNSSKEWEEINLFNKSPEEITGLQSGSNFAYILTNSDLYTSDSALIGKAKAPVEIPTAVLEHGDTLFVASENKISVYAISSGNFENKSSITVDGIGTIKTMVANVTLPQQIDLVAIGAEGLLGFSKSGDDLQAIDGISEFAAGRVPMPSPVCAANASDGGFVVGTEVGAYRMMDRDIGPEWRVYNGERWLPNEDIKALSTTPDLADSPIYFATPGGLAYVTAQWMTIEEKMDTFVERVVLRHDRDGAVADSRLTVPGDLSTSVPYDSDNDGGWTCYWVMSECFRYKMTGDPQAKANFDKSLDRMLSFQTMTGTDYFLARSVIRIDGCQLDDCDDPDDGEWFKSADGEWWVKADTSNDEVTSHMFMMGHAYDLCADDEQKQRIEQHVDNIVGGLVDHGYQLYDIDGEVTSYGQLDPEYVNGLAGKYADGGRRSAQMIANLTLAQYMTGDPKYDEAKKYLMEEHNYDENIIHESEPPFRKGVGDGDELATQAFFVLLRYEQDPELRAKWLEGWNKSYSNMRLQEAAMWDIINASLGGDDPDFFNATRWLKLVPMDLIRWIIHNDQRLDTKKPPEYYANHDNRQMRSDDHILPPDERPNIRHNAPQYQFQGGWTAYRELDGADVLFSYWLARYYEFIVTED